MCLAESLSPFRVIDIPLAISNFFAHLVSADCLSGNRKWTGIRSSVAGSPCPSPPTIHILSIYVCIAMKILLFILDKLLFRKYFLKKGSPPGGMGGSEKRKLYIYCPLCPLGCLSHRGRVDYPAGIPTIRLTEVFTMNTRIEKAFISIVMELPFYFTLSVRERHSLLSRLTKHYQSLISEFEKEQDLYKDLLKPNY